jgi:hypothetical protein
MALLKGSRFVAGIADSAVRLVRLSALGGEHLLAQAGVDRATAQRVLRSEPLARWLGAGPASMKQAGAGSAR